MTNNSSSKAGSVATTMAKGTPSKQVQFISKFRLEVIQAATTVLNINKTLLTILNIIADNDCSIQIKDTPLGRLVTLKSFLYDQTQFNEAFGLITTKDGPKQGESYYQFRTELRLDFSVHSGDDSKGLH